MPMPHSEPFRLRRARAGDAAQVVPLLVEAIDHLALQLAGASEHAACAGGTSAASSSSAWFGADFSGVPAGLDLALLVELPDGSAVTDSTEGLPQIAAKSGSGCFAIQVPAEQLGLDAMPPGTYHIQLYGGPSLAPIGTATTVSVGA